MHPPQNIQPTWSVLTSSVSLNGPSEETAAMPTRPDRPGLGVLTSPPTVCSETCARTSMSTCASFDEEQGPVLHRRRAGPQGLTARAETRLLSVVGEQNYWRPPRMRGEDGHLQWNPSQEASDYYVWKAAQRFRSPHNCEDQSTEDAYDEQQAQATRIRKTTLILTL